MKAKKKSESYMQALMKNPAEMIIVGALFILLLSAALFAIGAKDARIHFINALSDGTLLDVTMDRTLLFSQVDLGDMTEYTRINGGKYYFEAVESGTNGPVLLSKFLAFSDKFDYTVILAGNKNSIQTIFLGNDRAKPKGQTSLLRLSNANPLAPPVDLAVKGGPVLLSNVNYLKYADFITIDAGTYEIEIRQAGTAIVLKSIPILELKGGESYTAVLLGSGDGSNMDLAVYAETSNNWQKWRFTQ